MSRIRVLVVDDSIVVRTLLGELLGREEDIEVVASASSASMALVKIQQAAPDVVTLDVEMPGMNGLDLLAEIQRVRPALPVIMFSSLTQRAAITTLEALARGASDCVTKPSGMTREGAAAHVREQLVPKIRALAAKKRSLPPARVAKRVTAGVVPEIVCVACSTGGPNALAEIFRALPVLPVPVVVVQHMPPVFTRLLAERLNDGSLFQVHEGKEGDVLQPGHVHIAPGEHHMRVVAGDGVKARVALDQGPPENYCRPAADVLFRSVARLYGPNALAVVLTGMGQDGLRGCEALATRGAAIVAQDQASSVVWGMPGFVVRAGLATAVRPLHEIAAEIVMRVHARQGAA